MTEQNFTYWLQGFFEIAKPESISTEQVAIIKNHINLVKKCWEPKTPDKLNLVTEEFGMTLLPDEDYDMFTLPALDNSAGETVLRC